MAVTLQHQFSAAASGIGNLLKPAPAVTAVSGLTTSQPSNSITMPCETDAGTASALTLLESTGNLLHPALRNIKTINIGKLKNNIYYIHIVQK